MVSSLASLARRKKMTYFKLVWLDFDGSCVDSKFQTPGRSWTLWLLLALLAPRRMLQTTEITKNTDCCFDFHRSESRRQISSQGSATGFIDPSKILLWLHLDNFRLRTINQFWADLSTKSTTKPNDVKTVWKNHSKCLILWYIMWHASLFQFSRQKSTNGIDFWT